MSQCLHKTGLPSISVRRLGCSRELIGGRKNFYIVLIMDNFPQIPEQILARGSSEMNQRVGLSCGVFLTIAICFHAR